MKIKKEIVSKKSRFYQDLGKIIAIDSTKGPTAEGAPFGVGPKKALVEALKIASDYGFKTKIVNDAVGYAQLGDDDETYIGIVGHLDVVSAGEGWTYPPFELTNHNNRLYGRGVLDNKGPIMACLYGLKLLNDSGIRFNKTIRIIFGTDEESGSSDIPMYLSEEQAPTFGFTPDCKYPVVYGERGIVNVEIFNSFTSNELKGLSAIEGDQARDHVPDKLVTNILGRTIEIVGKRAPSNAPELGENAITLLANSIVSDQLLTGDLLDYFKWISRSFHNKHHGEGLGIAFSDKDSGALQLTPYSLIKNNEGFSLSVAIRYPVSFSEEQIVSELKKNLFPNATIKIVRSIPGVIFPKEDSRVKLLSEAYEKVTGLDSTPVTTTGATYARFMPNIVAFGPSFPGQKGIAHNSDEYMDESDLLLNVEIYMEAIVSLLK